LRNSSSSKLLTATMVIGEKFAWAHMQKTGGSATLAMFRLFPELIVFADPADDREKHSPFGAREELVRGKIRACNVRRLPAYQLSWAVWRARPGNEVGRKTMESPHEIAEIPRGDRRLAHITNEGRFPVERWLRMEHLAEDFLDFVSELTDVGAQCREQVSALRTINALDYDHDIRHWFSDAQIRRMYEVNPVWRSVEEKMYGDLLA
jgi:hypothetical protein